MLNERDTFGINRSFGASEKKFSISFTKQTQNFVSVCIIMLIIVISFLNRREILKFKPEKKMLTFQLDIVSEAYLMDLVLLSL